MPGRSRPGGAAAAPGRGGSGEDRAGQGAAVHLGAGAGGSRRRFRRRSAHDDSGIHAGEGLGEPGRRRGPSWIRNGKGPARARTGSGGREQRRSSVGPASAASSMNTSGPLHGRGGAAGSRGGRGGQPVLGKRAPMVGRQPSVRDSASRSAFAGLLDVAPPGRCPAIRWHGYRSGASTTRLIHVWGGSVTASEIAVIPGRLLPSPPRPVGLRAWRLPLQARPGCGCVAGCAVPAGWRPS